MASDDPEAQFARALSREMLASEILRSRVLAVALAVLLVVVTVQFAIAPDSLHQFFSKPLPVWLPALVVGPFLLYECLFLVALSIYATRGGEPPRPARYGNAIIETTLPTVIIFVASDYAEPAIAFGGWPSLLYFVFILASTLRLNFALPALTGAVAAIEYLGIAAYLLPLSQSAQDGMLTPLFHTGRAFIMLIAGIVAGLVAIRLRANLMRVLETAAARERVVNLFGQHVSPSVVDRLLDGDIAAEGEARHVCVMFVDIRDFTAFARERAPKDVVDFLNRTFAYMIEAVDRNHGIVNKFLGDGFMAIFGAPLVDPLASRHAVAAAREMLAEIDRRAAADVDETWLRIGIGLHEGMAVTGNIGSPQRKEFTVVGDIVNLAARIEQLNKEFGSRLLVSDAVAAALGTELGMAEHLSATVKGYAEPIGVWRLN